MTKMYHILRLWFCVVIEDSAEMQRCWEINCLLIPEDLCNVLESITGQSHLIHGGSRLIPPGTTKHTCMLQLSKQLIERTPNMRLQADVTLLSTK